MFVCDTDRLSIFEIGFDVDRYRYVIVYDHTRGPVHYTLYIGVGTPGWSICTQ